MKGSENAVVDGNRGNDVFNVSANIGGDLAINRLSGGAGHDTLNIDGQFHESIFLDDFHFSGIEKITFGGFHRYGEVTIDGNLADKNKMLTLDGSQSRSLFVDVQQATSAGYHMIGGHGNDTFRFGSVYKSFDTVDGGGGNKNDLSLDLSDCTVLSDQNIHNIQILDFFGTEISVVGDISGGKALTIHENFFDSGCIVDLSGADAPSIFVGMGGGDDTVIGSAGHNSLFGDKGADTFQVISGSTNVFTYDFADESTSTTYDTIHGFDALNDTFAIKDLSAPVAAVDRTVTRGSLSTASFDSDLSEAIGVARLAAGDAVLFKVSAGTLSGHTFLIVDANGVAGYQGGEDYVIDITGAHNLAQFGIGNFS